MQKIFRALSTKTARSTALYYFGSFVLNIFRYLFHLVLLRFLAPAEYGEFLSYLSLTYLISIPTGTIASVVTKFVAGFKGKDDHVSINLFFYYLLRVVSPITLLLGLLLIVLANPLALIFKAHSIAFIVLGISIFISLYQTVISSYLLAFQKFIFQTIVGLLGSLLTIGLSIFFIHFGLGATGAVIGQLLSVIITTLIIFLNIRPSIYPKIKTKKELHFSLSGFTGYSFLYTLGTMSLISTDVLLVRAFFDPHLSGLYSSLSILGRMIFFGLSPLIALVLPLVSHRHAESGETNPIFLKLGSVVLVFGITGAGLFTLFPSPIIRLLSGPSYLSAAPFLGLFAFSMVFFALSQFIISYLMAIGKPQSTLLLLLATIIQPIAYFAYRSSFSGVIWSNFILHLLLVISLAIYFFFTRSKSKQI